MQANIMKVKSCSEQFYVKSEKADNGQMANSLVGFEEALQVEMADCLTECVMGVAIYTTGIKHVDRILWPLYHKIQREQANKMFN